MRVAMLGVALAFCCGFVLAGDRSLSIGVHAPPLLGGKWIPDGKAPDMNGKVRLIHFWFGG